VLLCDRFKAYIFVYTKTINYNINLEIQEITYSQMKLNLVICFIVLYFVKAIIDVFCFVFKEKSNKSLFSDWNLLFVFALYICFQLISCSD